DGQQQAQAVHDDMALAAIDVLGVVPAAGLAARAAVHRLAVDAGGRPRPAGALGFTDPVAQPVVGGPQGAVVPPGVEVAPDGALGREVVGQVAPLAAGAQQVQDGVQDVTHRRLAGAASGVHGDQGLDQGPLLVGQVAGVSLGSHTPLYA